MKTCKKCGKENPDDAKFCKFCGANMDESDVPEEKKCEQCGETLEDDAVFCSTCGTKANDEPTSSEEKKEEESKAYQQYGSTITLSDEPSVGFNILSFFFPIVGLILYLVWNNETPNKAKACGKWALIGFLVGAVVSILLMIFSFGAFLSVPYYY